MNVAAFMRANFAKPVVVIGILIVALAAGAVGWMSVTPSYQSSGAVLVIPPGAGSTNAIDNPFANLEKTALLATVLATSASEDARAVVAKTGASPDYTLSTVAGDTGSGNTARLSPQITFAVSASNEKAAYEGALALIDFMRNDLVKLQQDAGVPQGTYADLRITVGPRPGVAAGASKLRTAVGYASGAVLGVIVVLLLIAAVGETFRRRKPADGDEGRASVLTDPAGVSEPATPVAQPTAAPRPESELNPPPTR